MRGELGLKFAMAVFVLFMLMIFILPSVSGPGYLPSFLSRQYVGYAFGIGIFIMIVVLLKSVMR